MSASTTLLSFASLQNDTSATSDLNFNFSAINTALTGCLSLTGQAPNQMQASLDMNSNRLLNLPAPISINEPMRLADATTLNGGGTVAVSQLPVGGTTGQVLTKNSNTNFDVAWQTPSVNVTPGKSLSVNNSLTLAGTDGTVITFQGTDTYVSRTSTDTFQNKTFNAATSGNSLLIAGSPVTGVTGSGAAVLATNPSITGMNLGGTVTGTPAFAGSNFISLVNLQQQAMFTLLGNTSTTTGPITAFTVGGLTQKPSPAATDYVMIQDNASSPAGALKYTPVSALATAGSVSSIAGNTGAFTLGIGVTNATNNIILDSTYHRGWLGGLTLSNDGGAPNTTIDIAQGTCTSDDGSYMMKLGTFTKLITANWVVGSGNGGLDTGSVVASTWYHVYVIARTDTGIVDALISQSATSPTMPASYTVKRRIGSIKTDASAHIILFIQSGDTFLWNTALTPDINGGSTGATTGLLITSSFLPTGVVNEGIFLTNLSCASSCSGLLSSPLVPDQAAAAAASQLSVVAAGVQSAQVRVFTNTSAQIRVRYSNASNVFSLTVQGWVDIRGKYA